MRTPKTSQISASGSRRLVRLQRARLRAVGEAISTASAFGLDDFVDVMNILHLGMDGVLRADFAAQSAGDAEAFDDLNFHRLSRTTQRPARFRCPGAQQKIENLLNGLLILWCERVCVDLIFTFHKVHQLFGFLAVQLMTHQIIVDDAQRRRNAQACH
jgi:hypothetical protein